MEATEIKALTDETAQLLKRYLAAAAHLYGIIPLFKLFEIYNSQNDPITEEQFLSFIDSIDFYKEYYGVFDLDEFFEDAPETSPMNRELLAEYLYALGDYDDYYKIRECQRGLLYYVPDKVKFLRYEDEYYFEKTPEFISLRAFIRSQPYLTKERADEIADEIQFSFKIDEQDPIFAVQYAVNLGLKIENDQMYDELVGLCYDVIRNTRMHIYRGHTAAEIQ